MIGVSNRRRAVTTEDETPVGTADAATPVRVLVADDSPAFLRAAVAVVAAAEGFELVGVARSTSVCRGSAASRLPGGSTSRTSVRSS